LYWGGGGPGEGGGAPGKYDNLGTFKSTYTRATHDEYNTLIRLNHNTHTHTKVPTVHLYKAARDLKEL